MTRTGRTGDGGNGCAVGGARIFAPRRDGVRPRAPDSAVALAIASSGGCLRLEKEIHLTARFDEAFRDAHELHRTRWRKGASVPHIAHPMGAAALFIERGGDKDQAIAAPLHAAST